MPDHAIADRRSTARYNTDGLLVQVRKKGRLMRLDGLAFDFNRYGLSMVLDQPLPQNATVFVNLLCGNARVDNIVAVVHNCVGLEHGYRCGLQFRTSSNLQFDRDTVDQELHIMERRFKVMTAAGAIAAP